MSIGDASMSLQKKNDYAVNQKKTFLERATNMKNAGHY